MAVYPLNMNVISQVQGDNIKVEVLEFSQLGGAGSISQAREIYFANKVNIKLRLVRILLNNSEVITEAGALYFLKGHVEADNKIGGTKGVMKGLLSNALTNESVFKPSYKGTGEVFLEPTFEHFAVLRLNNEEIIVDKGLFYCCEPTIEVGIAKQDNIKTAIAGGEGMFQTRLRGTGLVVIKIPVPENELIKYQLNNDKLQVDGSFALLRTGNIKFTVEKSAKTLLGSMTSGDGLLQTFNGTGQVWIAPTLKAYNEMFWNGKGDKSSDGDLDLDDVDIGGSDSDGGILGEIIEGIFSFLNWKDIKLNSYIVMTG